MNGADICPLCRKRVRIEVEGVRITPNGSSLSWGTCPNCGREVTVQFELSPGARAEQEKARQEWVAERRAIGAPILLGMQRQQGDCPSCGEWVEIELEEVDTNEQGHRLEWGTCPKCEVSVMSKLTERGLEWFLARPTM